MGSGLPTLFVYARDGGLRPVRHTVRLLSSYTYIAGLLQSRFLARQLSCCAWRVDELVRDYRYCNGNATAVAASVALDCWNNAAGVAEQHHHRLGQVRLLKMVIRRRIISTFSGRWASSSFGIGRTFFILESPNHHHLDQWEGHLHRPGSHPLSGKRQDLLYL